MTTVICASFVTSFFLFLQVISAIQRCGYSPNWAYQLVCQRSAVYGHLPYDLVSMGCDFVACLGFDDDGKHEYDICVSEFII
jgi:hypothetical protein